MSTILQINKILYNNSILEEHGLRPIFGNFIAQYMRLKISLDRKSRGEFVAINKQNHNDDLVQGMGALSSIQNSKK